MVKLGEGLNFPYEPIWPQAPVDMKFHYYEEQEDGTQVLKIRKDMAHLVTSIEELKEYILKCEGKIIAFDTETTGLSYGKDKIVGFSFSLNEYSGVYVPIRHQVRVGTSIKVDKLDANGNQILTKSGKPSKTTITTYEYFDRDENLDAKEALDVLYQILIRAKRVLMHNSEFDLNMLKFEGYDVTKIPSFDTLILPYLYDPEATNLAGLKALEKRVLGRTVPEFKDVLGKEAENFAFVAPQDGYEYACYDKETEVLTENGWVLWSEYDGKDLLATFNMDKKSIEYQFPSSLYKYKYKGKMECCETEFISYCVTPNHSMMVQKEEEGIYKWVLKRADELNDSEVMLTLNNDSININVKGTDRFQKEYNDYVYCAEVPNHTLIVRRNEKVLVAGNCYDTSGTYGIFKKMLPEVQELLGRYKDLLEIDGKPYRVLSKDNEMVIAFVDYYDHAKILIDKEKAQRYKEQLIAKRNEVVEKIYKYFDVGPFNLSASSNEFKKVMASKKVFTGVLTDKGGPSWSKSSAAEMKRNLAKIRDGLQQWRSIPYVNGVLSKKGPLAFNFAASLEIYGKYYFKIKKNIDNLVIKNLKGQIPDFVTFWKTVQQLYKSEMGKLEVLGLIHENNSTNKALNSYVDKLTQVDECCMRYRLKGTKSGRLSSGNGSKSDKKKNTYYIDLNAQNLTKPASAYYVATEVPIEDSEAILGWKFEPVEKDYAMEHLEDLYIVEGQDPGITIRGCLKAPEGRYVVSLDYDAQEYRLAACLSRDHQMLENFHNGIDPHTASAYAIWGEENYDKAKRKKAKIFNFLNNYSGGAGTLSQQLDIPKLEAQKMIDKYNATFFEMVQWKQKEIAKMYANDSVVFTPFGRPRQFKGWMQVISKCETAEYSTLLEQQKYQQAANRVQSAIERRVNSHIIQGCAGDILRSVMLKLYNKYFKNRNPHIDFMSTVHDEINYTIDKEVVIDYTRDLEEIMTFDKIDPTLPIATSTDIGFTYGNMFPFVWTDETKTKMIPKRVHHA